MVLTKQNTLVIMAPMNWQKLIAELQAAGLSQVQIGQRLGKSQAWVSAAAAGKYDDLRWGDGQRLIDLHREVTSAQPVLDAPPAAAA